MLVVVIIHEEEIPTQVLYHMHLEITVAHINILTL